MYNYIEGERKDGENNRLGGRGGNFSEAKRGGPNDRGQIIPSTLRSPFENLTFFFVNTRGRFKKKKKKMKRQKTKIQFKNYNYNIYVFTI